MISEAAIDTVNKLKHIYYTYGFNGFLEYLNDNKAIFSISKCKVHYNHIGLIKVLSNNMYKEIMEEYFEWALDKSDSFKITLLNYCYNNNDFELLDAYFTSMSDYHLLYVSFIKKSIIEKNDKYFDFICKYDITRNYFIVKTVILKIIDTYSKDIAAKKIKKFMKDINMDKKEYWMHMLNYLSMKSKIKIMKYLTNLYGVELTEQEIKSLRLSSSYN